MGNTPTRHREDSHSTAPPPPPLVHLGQVAPYEDGVYKNAPQDWDKEVVATLITQQRMAPFYNGLADYEETNESVRVTNAAASQSNRSTTAISSSSSSSSSVNPAPPSWISARRVSTDRNHPSAHLIPHHSHSSSNTNSSNPHHPPALKGKRSQSMPNRLTQQHSSSALRQEDLYKFAIECPICFLYYPANINYSRCCDQPICTECFVQIKRPESTLEPAACPFCVETNFGILYHAPGSPEHKMKLIQAHPDAFTSLSENDLMPPQSAQQLASSLPASTPILDKRESLSTTSSPDQASTPDLLAVPRPPAPFKRRQSVSHQSALVVTSDDLRPDWLRKQQQLALMRAASQRRNTLPINSHAAAIRRTRQMYLESDSRDLAGAASAAAALVEGLNSHQQHGVGHSSTRHGLGSMPRSGGRIVRSGRGQGGDVGSNYLEAMRNMGADLEELMLMEAIRRSLQAEGETAVTTSVRATATSPDVAPSSAPPPPPPPPVPAISEPLALSTAARSEPNPDPSSSATQQASQQSSLPTQS
ncbi:hypothetical protein DFJ77DRAFT_511813 [Powellomyces hirtus]|nr:hypothetical protein DFJ77DRAFT_511813 [Powellomyces hirtus]